LKEEDMTDDQTPAEDQALNDDLDTQADTAAETDALKAEVAALKEQVLRYAADAENTRRRAERESNDARAYAIQRFAKDLVGAADNLENALKHAPHGSEDAVVRNFAVGVEMTEKALQTAFERNGLKKVDPAKGDRFDPHLHQAMMEQASGEVDGGAVIQTLQAGYELQGRLVRPAMVVVAAKTAGAPDGGANPYGHANGAGAGGTFDTKA
jgi:molecular chaperone GrpE